jgi:hypothetical protein
MHYINKKHTSNFNYKNNFLLFDIKLNSENYDRLQGIKYSVML